ncbi:MAG: glutamate synthase large subunit [Spirochaetales bacterium]|nr:glutamate synthase large subunit [Spirochaetales bacterium]
MKEQGLYNPKYEHDACGVGFAAEINGNPSHQIVQDGIKILNNLEHRGAVGGDVNSGDGAGLLAQIPYEFFIKETEKLGFTLPGKGELGIGMFFLPMNKADRQKAVTLVNRTVESMGAEFLGWRDVPVNGDCLGETAKSSMPFIRQLFVRIAGLEPAELERRLYIIRRSIEKEAGAEGFSMDEFYIPSFSSRTIIYKGMFVAPQMAAFFSDLSDPDFKSSLVLVHQRYSTNTFPSWALAQPFRYVAHNGEINTLKGNIGMMKARENTLASPLFGDDLEKILPAAQPDQSDSATFDNVFELLHQGGRSMEHTMMMMVPEAWGNKYHISQDKRAFYEYHSTIMEPWDGPAALAFTDGIRIGAALDRNGLRPARYVVTRSGRIVLASEIGVLEIPPEDILNQGRLGPGKILLVDTEKGRVCYNNEVKASVSRRRPYRRWLEENKIELKGFFQAPRSVEREETDLDTMHRVFGYTLEDLQKIIYPMARDGQEPLSSMGNDAPLAVLSKRPQLLYNYFKQVFAQVTNPPIDPYRENLVMSLMSFIGREENILAEEPGHCHKLKLPHPVLTNDDMETLRRINLEGYTSKTLSILYGEEGTALDLESSLQELYRQADEAIAEGCSFLILSDRGVGPKAFPIPALLAVSALHQYLVRQGTRQLTALLVESGEVREVMHYACLIGFGASAVNPYLVFETLADFSDEGRLPEGMKLDGAIENYITAVKKGLLKVMSKMGVSTIRSYRGAQIFEAIGLSDELIKNYFDGVPSRIGGIGLDSITSDIERRQAVAYGGILEQQEVLDSGGNLHYRMDSEKHLMTPEAVVAVQRASRDGDYEKYKEYASIINERSETLCTLRGLFRFKDRTAIPIDEVEPVENIVKRFVSSAMSLGSISREAHETLAIAMNRLGGMSNSGEGGENEERFVPFANGDSAKSFVKQVASGRFGVTINYMQNAGELQIKMAQGAKPGEGGQLPGHKVDEFVASVRHSTPGVMLISPPPHHDIYSIEDLSQLIFDLKNANPDARVSVKLVSEVGVGTIAAGVAKGKADMVLISGHDGGTGASPISSIKHTGIPWEIGLAETQQTLVLNSLRSRIRIQTDGQLRTGRDVVIAALLGAEEFGFGTISLVNMGCIMMRKCHKNTCPVGVATQDPELRKRFQGKPENLVNFMTFVARDVREIMAELGFRTVDEMVGQVDVLEVDNALDHYKASGLDFSRILTKPGVESSDSLRCTTSQDHGLESSLDYQLIKRAEKALEKGEKVELDFKVRNRNRTVGTTLSSRVARKYGSKGLPEDTISCRITGDAGQSFGAFLAPGITLNLRGTSNDYLGKGLSGGKIILRPPEKATFRPQNNIITGNVNLFGATSGSVFINGRAGERFAVRNSGAIAVVEGVGDHGCEYMTGGVVVVLGKTGINFAAGMSGGIAYVLDEDQLFDTMCNLDMVDIEPVIEKDDVKRLKGLVKEHVKYTGSEYAKRILRDWVEMAPAFVKVIPVDYKLALERLKAKESRQTETVDITEEVYV